ncbi:MAG: VTT domain-containing protein [Ignavibacteriales bacterium]|nr:VTT domain-containing protein [Ignavibacteriales bacterium]
MDVIREFFSRLTNIHELVTWAGYPGLAMIVFSETGLLVGFFLPGDSLLVTAGLFAAAGFFNVGLLIPLLILCAVCGNATGYFIGKKGGQALYARKDSRFFKKQHLLKTKEFYEQYGPMTIVMAQFMPFARTFAPVVAGIAEMKYVKFASYNVIGAISWITSMVLIGYFLGSTIPNIDKNIHYVIVLVVFVSLLPGIFKYLQVKWAARKAQ